MLDKKKETYWYVMTLGCRNLSSNLTSFKILYRYACDSPTAIFFTAKCPSGFPSRTCCQCKLDQSYGKIMCKSRGAKIHYLTEENASIGTHTEPIFFSKEGPEISLRHLFSWKCSALAPIFFRRPRPRSAASRFALLLAAHISNRTQVVAWVVSSGR